MSLPAPLQKVGLPWTLADYPCRQEWLSWTVTGEAHLRYILREYESWYNEERAHQGVGNVRLRQIGAEEAPVEVGQGAIVCRERLGGLLKHYHRQAA